MPQIGWFEILVIVVLAILIIGPKDFPFMLKKIGSWIKKIKKYFNNIQEDFSEIENSVEEEIFTKEDLLKIDNDKKVVMKLSTLC